MKIYLQMNLILIVSFIFFRLVRAGLAHLAQECAYKTFVRSAQFLLLVSVIAPVGLSFVPLQNLPKFELGNVRSMAESAPTGHVFKAIPLKQSSEMTPLLKARETWEVTRVIQDRLLTPSTAVIFFVGFLTLSFRLWRKASALKALILESTLVRNMGRVSIRITEAIEIPFSTLIGGRAHVVLPFTLLSSVKGFRIALRHELQHHRQGDTAWAVAMELLLCVFFMNPFIYLWKKEITELQELSCDEILIGQKRISPHDYGSCLVRVAEAALGNHSLLVGTACMGVSSKNPTCFKSFLGRRIEMLVAHEKLRGSKSFGTLLGTLTFLFTVGIAYGLQRGFRNTVRAVTGGTGGNARSLLYTTAGKTSTGHFHLPNPEKYHELHSKSDFGGFVGFAPATQPRIVVYAAMIEPKGKHVVGNTQAAPVFREIVEEVLQYMKVAPDQTGG